MDTNTKTWLIYSFAGIAVQVWKSRHGLAFAKPYIVASIFAISILGGLVDPWSMNGLLFSAMCVALATIAVFLRMGEEWDANLVAQYIQLTLEETALWPMGFMRTVSLELTQGENDGTLQDDYETDEKGGDNG